MHSFWKYLLIGLLVFGLVFVVAFPFFIRGFGGYSGYGMMYPGGMMGGWGFGPMMGSFGIFGGLMMLLAFLLPLGLISLIVFGVISLLRRPATTITPPAYVPTHACPSCGKPAQADWKTCPYCGQNL